MTQAPIAYHPGLETPADDEADTIAELNRTFDTILERVADDEGHAYRAVHAKSHGLIEARLTVLDDLPPELAQGIFARPGAHDAILRVSTNPGDVLDDSVSVPRGVSLKVLDVQGDRLEGSETDRSQDFIMVDGPVFTAKDAAAFLKNLKLLAKTTDRAQWAKKLLSTALRGVDKVLTATTGPSPTIRTMGGAPNSHPLALTYYSQTPYRYGDHVAKVQLVPVLPRMTELADHTVHTRGRPDAIREDMNDTLQSGPARWELRVQLCRDPESQPIEDSTVAWDEAAAPFQTVAVIEAAPQPGWTPARARAVDDGMRFSPWNGTQDHRPLGSINRARRQTYRHSSDFRARVNGCPVHDPASARLPD